MNRYDHHFRRWEPHLRAIPLQKVGAARGALFEHRANGFGPEDDEEVVRQFDLSGMGEFWEIELSEPMTCVDFTRSLASHFFKIEDRAGLMDEDRLKLGPVAERVVGSVKAGIRQALRAARSYGKPWFMEIPEPPPSIKLDPNAWMGFVPSDVVIVPPDPPADGIDLNKLRVQPRAAVEWMLASAQRRHLVPPSLVAVMSSKERDSGSIERTSKKLGRPIGTGLDVLDAPFVESIVALVREKKASSVADAAQTVVGDGSGVPGGGKVESKVDRLRRKARNVLKSGE